MFGAFRLFLAMAVAFSHMGVSLAGFHPGVAAVVSFYVISGYVMTGLIQTTYSGIGDVPRFYKDRVLRLAPQYYFFLVICAFTVLVLNWREYQPGPASPLNIFSNITVIPLELHMFSQDINNLILNLPTWTLGLELCFYLILPFMLMSRTLLYAATFVGAVVFMAATHGLVHPDYYAYRLLPGVLVFFSIGISLQRRDWPLFGALAAVFVIDGALLAMSGKLNYVWNASLLTGAALGLIVVPALARLPRNLIDDRLGAASYGCYLSHWIFVSALKQYYGQPWAVATTVIGSAVVGWLAYIFVEAPTVRFRHRLRRRLGTGTGGSEPAHL